MYVVKVGEFYVKNFNYYLDNNGKFVVTEMILSKEIMKGFKFQNLITLIAESVNGEVVYISEEATND